MPTIRATVAAGRRVRLPDGRILEEGVEHLLEHSIFVLRRLDDGDLVAAPAPKTKGK